MISAWFLIPAVMVGVAIGIYTVALFSANGRENYNDRERIDRIDSEE